MKYHVTLCWPAPDQQELPETAVGVAKRKADSRLLAARALQRHPLAYNAAIRTYVGEETTVLFFSRRSANILLHKLGQPKVVATSVRRKVDRGGLARRSQYR